MSEKLIFPIGFDLESGVKQVKKDWEGTYQKRISDLLGKKPIDLRVRLSAKGFSTKELQEFIRLANKAKKSTKDAALASKYASQISKNEAQARSQTALAIQRENRAKEESLIRTQRLKKADADATVAEMRLAEARQNGYSSIVRTNSALGSQLSYLQRLLTRMSAYVGIYQAFTFIRNIKDVTAQFELQRVALGAIIQDAAEANKMFEQIKAAAIKSPFQIKELVTFTKQLAAYKIETNELFETTQRLSDISAGLGVSMDRIVLAYGQIRATGYLRASEVRQLTEAGIPIVESLAKKMSELRDETVSAADVMQLISERAISFGMVKDIFEDMTSAGGLFYKMQEKQADTLQGRWNNLRDTLSIMYEEIGKDSFVRDSMEGTISLIKSMASNWSTISNILFMSISSMMVMKARTSLLALEQKKLTGLLGKETMARYDNIMAIAKEEVEQAKLNAVIRNSQKEARFGSAAWAKQFFGLYDKNIVQKQVEIAVATGALNKEIATQAIMYGRTTLAQREAMIAVGLLTRAEVSNAMVVRTNIGLYNLFYATLGKARKAFASLLNIIKANWFFIAASLIPIVINAATKVSKLNKELSRIGKEGNLNLDQSVRNFKRLADVISESADGSYEQQKALEELKRTYGDIIPAQDLEVEKLREMKGSYDSLTKAIREKIAAQIEEQKISTIISNYGQEISKRETKAKNYLGSYGLSKDEASRVVEGIKEAVEQGKFSLNQLKNNAYDAGQVLEKVFVEQLGKDVRSSLGYKYIGGASLSYERSIRKLIETYLEMETAIKDVNDEMEKSIGSFGVYSDLYEKLQDALKKNTGKGREFSFEWNETKTQEAINDYVRFVNAAIAQHNKIAEDSGYKPISFKAELGKEIDFDALTKAIEGGMPQLKKAIAKVQAEYSNLLPKGMSKLIKEKWQEISDETGVAMDKLDNYFKDNETDTKKWAESLQDNLEKLELKLFDLNRQQERFNQGMVGWRDLSSEIKATNEEITALTIMLKFFDELLEKKSTGKNPKIEELNNELSTVEKIYKKYQELRRFMSEADAKASVNEMFKGVNLKYLQMAVTPEQMREQYESALSQAKDLGDNKLILDIEYSLGEFNVNDSKKKMEEDLKDLSDKIAHTKTAKEFFDRMLGMTGDKQLSATLTLSVYGTTGDDLQKLMTKQVTEAFKNLPEGFDVTKAMLGDGKFDYNLLESWIEKLPEQDRKSAQSIVENWRKTNQDIITDLYKTYEEFLSFEERKTRVVEKENAERMRIINSGLPMAEQEKLVGASQNRENKALADIAIEEFKASADWAKSFEDLEHLATPTIERLMAKLKEFIDTQKDLTPEQLKTLTNEYKKLYGGLIARNPFKAMTDGIKEYVAATKDVKTAKDRVETAQEELRIATERKAAAEQNFKTSQDVSTASREYASAIKEYNEASQNAADADKDLGAALDNQKKALNKTVQGFNAASSAISNFGSIITDITEIIGIAEDSEVGAFIKDLVKWLGVMASVLGTVAAIIAVIEAELAPLLAIAAGIAAIGAAISFFSNAKVRKANKEIERQQELLDNLAYSYERLEKSQEKVFGSDYISNYEQRIANLQAQQEAYLKQADAERSKGKKADSDKIKQYEEQAREAADSIKDMQSEVQEYFLGTDMASAARDFAQAWIDAYVEFGNTTDAMKEKFSDMIQNMIVESFAAKIIQSALEPIFSSIDTMTKDGMLDVGEAVRIAQMTDDAVGNIDVGMSNLMTALESAGITVRDMGSGLTGISKDIATASEESILGLAAGINTQNFYISQVPTKLDTIISLLQGGNLTQGLGITLQDLVTIQNQHLAYLPNIAQNTAETVSECKLMVAETRRTADALERVIKPKGTQTTYTLNTTIN